MTYLQGCGDKIFQDIDARCGESAPRPCQCGPTQNSVQVMLLKFGPSAGSPPPTPANPPTISVLSPSPCAVLKADTEISIVAEVTGDLAIASVELVWDFTNASLPCPGGSSDWSCSKLGNTHTWKLRVGRGVRTYRIRAKNSNGDTSTTDARVINLVKDAPGRSVKRRVPSIWAAP